MIELIEPPFQRRVASIPGGWRRCLHAVRLVWRAAKPDMHMGGMAVPRPDQPQPAAIACHLPAKLLLDRRIHQDPVHIGKLRRHMQQPFDGRVPHGWIDIAPIRSHHARQLHCFPDRAVQRCLCRISSPTSASNPI